MNSLNSLPPVQAADRAGVTTTKTTTTITTVTTTTTTTSQDTTAFTPFRFPDLPVELRVMVYEELVIVGKVFYTPDTYAVENEARFEDWESYPVSNTHVRTVCETNTDFVHSSLGSVFGYPPHLQAGSWRG